MVSRLPLKYKWISSVLVGCYCIFFTGCSIQNQRADVLSIPKVDATVIDGMQSKAFIPDAFSNEKWWEVFEDDQLCELIELALEKSPTLEMAEEKVLAAHDLSKIEFSSLMPSLDMSVSDGLAALTYRRKGVEVADPSLAQNILPKWLNLFNTILSFDWKLDIFGKQRYLYKASLNETKMQMAQSAYQKLLLSMQVARVYFNLQSELELQKALNTQLDLYQRKLNVVQKRYECGLSDASEIDQIEKSILNQNKALLQVQEELSHLKVQLGVYTALNPNEPLDIEYRPLEGNLSILNPSCVPIDLLAKRPDVVAKIWSLQAMTQRINSAKVSFLPSFDLASISGYFTLTYPDLLKPRAWFTTLFPKASLPIFHALKIRSRLNYTLRQYNLAVYDYNDTLLKASQEVVDNVVSIKSIQEKMEEQQALMQVSEHLYEISNQRFFYGLNNVLALFNAEIDLIEDQKVWIQLKQLKRLSILSLIKSIGGGYENKEAQKDLEQDFIYE